MKPRTLTLAALALAAIAAAIQFSRPTAASAQPAAPQPAAKQRIGLYDSRAIAVAYSASEFNSHTMNDLQRQLKEAEAAKDDKKAAQIKAQGAKLQDLRHLQGFSIAPVDDLLVSIQDKLPAIAKEAGVEIIVARIDYQSPAIEAVDVTGRMVAEFKPSEKTLKTIAELRKTPPMPMIDMLGMKH